MMKQVLAASAALTMAAFAASASAAPVSGSVTLNATVPNSCGFTKATDTVNLGDVVGPDGKLDASKFSTLKAQLSAYCTGPDTTYDQDTTVTLSTGNGQAENGFNKAFTLNVNGTVTGDNPYNGQALLPTKTFLSAFTGDFNYGFTDAGGNTARLAAGAYQGSFSVTLTPAS